MAKEWTCKERKAVYEGERLTLFKDRVETSNGKETSYTYVEQGSSVEIVALNEQGEIYLVRQYRYPVRQESWEFPAGHTQNGEDPAETARRELQEEIRMTASKIETLGQISSNASLLTSKCTILLATGLQPAKKERDETEGDLLVKTFPLEKIEEMVREGLIHDSTALATLTLFKLRDR
jgi:ADP-ribose pyrophosphatase